MLIMESLEEANGVKNIILSEKDRIATMEFDEKKTNETSFKNIIEYEGREVE